MKTKLILTAAAISLASCGDKQDTTTTPTAASPALMAVIDATVEDEAQAIHQARVDVKPGQTITVNGWVMGNLHPFVEGRAAFILGDPEIITACSEMGDDDHCETPWDACCDTPENKQRGTATIQIVGDDGRVLKEGIEGVQGIENLAKLIVSGTVAEGSSEQNLVINASAIDLQP